MEIIAENLYKEFYSRPVVDNVSFGLKKGKVMGLLGPNGAGKTTILRMILDVIKPDGGCILFDENPMNSKIRNAIGYLPEERGIYQRYPVIDVLVYFGRLKGMPKKKAHVEAVRLLDRFDLIERLEYPVYRLSRGMQQKLQLIIALIHDPQILIFDEPFTGLDPINQDMARKIINRFREEERTIILSTHQMNEAEKLCDEILVINGGKTVLQGEVQQIRDQHREKMILVEADDNLQDLQKLAGVKKVLIDKKMARLYVDEEVPAHEILREIINTIQVSRLEVNRPSLNDIFLEVVNHHQGKKNE